MKNIFSKALLIASMTLFSVLPMAAQALGTSCENPFVITEEFSTTITEPGSYWFSVTTYDLPLRVRYTPDVPTGEKMMAYVDFSCTPGVYDDPNLYELTDLASGWGYEMPMLFDNVQKLFIDGKYVHEIEVSESYRAIMTSFGILYNVEAKVNVIIPQSGSVAVIPDTVFRHTVENSHWIELPDTIGVGVSTVDSMYILPLTDWAGDSVRIEWLGKDAPVSVWIGSDIDFQLDATDNLVVDHFTLYPTEGDNVKDFSRQYIDGLLNAAGAGMFFAKIITAEDAQIVFDYKPMSPEMERAIPMEMDKAVEVKANDIDQYYYFDKEWSKQSLTFTAAKMDTVVAYFGTTPDFAIDASSANYLGSYTLYPEGRDAVLYLSSKELSSMADLCQKEFIFVRFASDVETTITPSIWNAGACTANSVEIFPEGVVEVVGNNKDKIYRIDYNKWSKGDVEMIWEGRVANKFYLSDTCSYALSSSSSPHVLLYQSVKANQSLYITKAFLDSVADRVDAEGFLYFRFDTRATANIQTIFTLDSTSIPVEENSPCVLASTLLEPKAELVLNLDKAFDIYRIDYQAWLASGVKLFWTGASPLHTFVAKDCEFAVAIYHKDVVNYTEVPAEGNVILSKDILATLGQYVDEDGYLYIRFLTELEGALTTQLAE